MTNTKTFRLFISSTFNDFKLERQVLHEKVFPVIDKYCTKNGYQFQPVDLRWGVNDEAQLDQKALELCLSEVRACKHFPHPNFLIMLGNRYGWVPLPYAIEASEFEIIKDVIAKENSTLTIQYKKYKVYDDSKDKTKYQDEQKEPRLVSNLDLLNQWYNLDENELPASYTLNAREKEYEIYQNWEAEENALRTILQEVVDSSSLNKEQKRKYFLSATEAEVEEGIIPYIKPTPFQEKELLSKDEKHFDIDRDRDYVYGFVRHIKNHENADLTNEPARSYIDKDQTKVTNFKKELIDNTFKQENIHKADVTLSDDAEKPFADESYLLDFEDFMLEKLKNTIDTQIKESQEISPLEQEISEQSRFKSLKTGTFFGRDEELKEIEEYIDGESNQPFIVHGVSGIGKSSFVAKAIDEIENKLAPSLFYRFIGATASSSNIRTLLESLVQELSSKEIVTPPETLEQDNNRFYQQVKELLATINKPTVIVLDALDQLQHKDYLLWLPLELPSNLKIILSMLDQKGYEHYYELLKNKISSQNQLHIKPLNEDAAKATLKSLLEKEKRGLSKKQFDYVIETFKESDSSPLYLKIAFEEVKTWKSSDTQEDLGVGVQEIIKEFIDNLSKKYHHSPKIVQKVLGILYASKNGLSEKEILDILSRDEDILKELEKYNKLDLTIDGKKVRRFPISAWARLHEQLKPFINERSIDKQNLIYFFHRQIDEAVREHVYKKNDQQLHTELAEYFLTLQDRENSWDKRYYNLHMLDEVPHQLFCAKESQRLKEILFDLEFVGSVYNNHKQEGFREILEKASELDGITQNEIYPLESFFREKEYLITRVNNKLWRPHQSLFQLAYEDGDNSSLSEKAQLCLDDDRVDFLWLQRTNRPKKFRRTGLVMVLKGLTKDIEGIEVLKDGKILSYSYDNTPKLWSSKGELITVLKGHTGIVKGAKILEGDRILSYSDDNTLRLWSSEGEPIAVLEGHTDSIKGVDILKDGKILSYSYDNTLRLWSSEGELIIVLDGHTNTVTGAEILEDDRILSYSWDGTLRLWSSDGEPIVVLEEHTRTVTGAKILKDGKILSYSYDNTLRLWSSKGELITVLKGHTSIVKGAKILEGDRILSYSDDNTLRLWSSEGEPIAVLEGHTDSIKGVDILKDGKIVSYSNDKTLRLWSSEGELIIVLDGHIGVISGAKILKDGKILSCSYDKTLRLWSSEGESLAVLEGHTGWIKGVKILEDGRILSYSSDKTLRLWDLEGMSFAGLERYVSPVKNAKIFKDGKILSSSDDDTLQLWSSEGEPIAVLEGHTSTVTDAEITEDGKILSYSKDNTLRLWSSKGEPIAVLEGHTGPVAGAKILKDGKILSCSYDNTLRLWSSDGEHIVVLEGHTAPVAGAEILEDDRILSYSWDGTLRLWSSEGKSIAVLEGHTGTVSGVKTSEDGKILSYSNSSDLRLWNSEGEFIAVLDAYAGSGRGANILENGKILSYQWGDTLRLWSSEGEPIAVLEGHRGYIEGAKSFKDGRILSYSADKTLRLWSSKGEPIAVLKGHTSSVKGAEILEGDRILSYSDDDTLRLWSTKGKKLTLMNVAVESMVFHNVNHKKFLVSSGSSLFLYNYCIQNQNITIDEATQKFEEAIYEDGI